MSKTEKRTELPGFTPTPRRSGWRNLFGCLLWVVGIGAIVGGVIGGIWWWHPWEYRSSTVTAEASDCPEGQRGMKSVDRLYILGVDFGESGSAVICVGEDS